MTLYKPKEKRSFTMNYDLDIDIAKKGKCRECKKRSNEVTLYRIKKVTRRGESFSYICKGCSEKIIKSVIKEMTDKEDEWIKEVVSGTKFENSIIKNRIGDTKYGD